MVAQGAFSRHKAGLWSNGYSVACIIARSQTATNLRKPVLNVPRNAFVPESETTAWPTMGEPAADGGSSACVSSHTAELRQLIQPDEQGVYHIAAFDFDGTCIRGNSPVMLVKRLAFSGKLKLLVILRIIWWALRYKWHLPQNESSVRGLVFSAFAGKPKAEVDAFLRSFGRENVAWKFREGAHEAMDAHVRAGHVVLCLSATFEPILWDIVPQHPVHYQISTRMKVDERGCYVAQVDGLPVEGAEKLNALKRFADFQFGEGNWVLDWAYCDHYSDFQLLKAAGEAFACCPTRTLTRIAKREGWVILDWPDPVPTR